MKKIIKKVAIVIALITCFAPILNSQNSYKLVIDYQFDQFWNFSEGLAAVEKDGKWGFIDKTGNLVIDYQFNRAGLFCEGLVNVKKNGKFGYIDKNGKLVIDYQFDGA